MDSQEAGIGWAKCAGSRSGHSTWEFPRSPPSRPEPRRPSFPSRTFDSVISRVATISARTAPTVSPVRQGSRRLNKSFSHRVAPVRAGSRTLVATREFPELDQVAIGCRLQLSKLRNRRSGGKLPVKLPEVTAFDMWKNFHK